MSPKLPNPFAIPVETPVPERAPVASETRWGILASAPPINPAEVESSEAAVEVVILWGDENVLHVEHVSPPRDITIGEGGDYLVGAELLGTERLPVVIERDGKLCCVVPEGASGTVSVGETSRTFAELDADGKLLAFGELRGAKMYPLPDGATARVCHRGLTFLVRPTNAGKELASAAPIHWRRYSWVGISLAVHAALLMMFYFMPPSSQALSLDNVNANDRLVQFAMDATETVQEDIPDFMEEPATEEPGGTGERHDGEEGDSGREDSPETHARYGIQGNSATPVMARENAAENMQTIGAIGAVRALFGSWDTPTSPYGADQAIGADEMSAIGDIMGDHVGNNFGFNGLGMTGTGRGAGGHGLGTYGLGTLGTLGHGGGRGNGDGYGDGYGRSPNLHDREHTDRVPQIRETGAHVVGSLSQEAIRRVVRRHLPEVRFCYEQGLQQNPSLEGRVTVSWIISPAGTVQSASIAPGSSLQNGQVESCIATAVRRWSFPQPDGGGTVGVNYPFTLQMN
jgi:TonB family protein